MPINMSCPSCGKSLSAPDTAAGKKARCPSCANIMTVPTGVYDAEEISSAAPELGQAEYPTVGDNPGFAPPNTIGESAVVVQQPPRRPCRMCGEQIVATAGKCRFCGAIFDPRLRAISTGSFATSGFSPTERIEQIRSAFKWWWICLAVGAGLCLTCVGAIVGIPGLVAAVVYQAIMLYRLWCTVQDGGAQTTPGQAVGFMFIPFFNIYWQFVAIWGLSKDLNRVSRNHQIAAPEANEGLAPTYCILSCCSLIPYLGILPAIAGLIVLIVLAKGMCDTDVAIVENSSLA